jgi:hypothetical protein
MKYEMLGSWRKWGNRYKTLAGMPEGREPFTGPNGKLEDNLKRELRKNLNK